MDIDKVELPNKGTKGDAVIDKKDAKVNQDDTPPNEAGSRKKVRLSPEACKNSHKEITL